MVRRGYTILELLITIVILTAIYSCLVFNFSKSDDTVKLNNGVSNIQTLFLFSKSHALNTGKKVKILFPETESGDTGEALREKYPNETVVVLVDDKPLESVRVYLDIINSSVNIESANNSETIFYPDGMNDTVVITVSSVSEEDVRKIEISSNDFSTKTKETSAQYSK